MNQMKIPLNLFFFPAMLCAIFLSLSFSDGSSYAGQKELVSKDQKVTFNFVDVELPVITKFISEITKKNFVFDERVKGKITIIAPSKLNIDEAFNLFVSVLELKGFTMMPSGTETFKIINSSDAKQKGILIAGDRQPVNETYIARIINLKYVSSDDALKFIQPIVSKDGHVSSFGPGNLMLVIDSGVNIEKILKIAESIDQQPVKDGSEVAILRYSSSDAVSKIINEGIGRKQKQAQQVHSGEEGKAVSDSRLNAVVLFGDRSAREYMKSLIRLLDVPSPETQGRINLYFLENADATELAKVVDGIVKGASVQQRQAGTGTAPVSPFESGGGITVTADKATNALIVVASPSDFQSLSHVIKQLDRRRKQVYVEAMIVEASVDKLRELGTKWRVMGRSGGEPIAIGGFGTMDSDAIQSVISGLGGATLGGLGNYLNVPLTSVGSDGTVTTSTLTVPGFSILFNLNEFRDAVNVLSTPQILTSDNREAEIVVGENVPFISKRERDSTSSTVLSSIERKDVGITLKITPQITEGDYVKLDIYQEISSVKQESENIILNVGPTTTKRSTKTSVVVKDRQTVVIGGLIQEKEDDSLTSIPVLGDIPVLGWLFKTKSTEKKKTNLLVFLSPQIVKESDRIAEITSVKQKEFKQSVSGELLVRFRDGITRKSAEELIAGQKAYIVKVFEGGVYHIRLKNEQDAEQAAREFLAIPDVLSAEPDYKIRMK